MTQSCDRREIQGFPGYLVTSSGEVLTCRKKVGFKSHYRPMSPSTDAKGYFGVTLCGVDGKRRTARVHRLVAEAFIQNPDCLPCVRHLDGDPKNNSAANLAWGTYAQNEEDKIAHGTWDTRRNGKLSEDDRKEAFEMRGRGWTHEIIAARLGVSRPTITRLLNGNTWGDV